MKRGLRLVGVADSGSGLPLVKARFAVPGDAPAIVELLRTSFSQLLLHTPFQSAAYEHHLRAQLDSPAAAGFVVAPAVGPIKGCYQARPSPAGQVLNYIAVGQSDRGAGMGDRLLNHFEQQAASAGGTHVVLDVLDDSQPYAWYLRRGYEAKDRWWSVRTRLVAPPSSSASEPSGPAMSVQDYDDEAGRQRVFWIDEGTCKLLRYDGCSLDQAIANLSPRFQGRILLFRSDVPVAVSGSVLEAFRLVRMTKRLS